MSFFSLVSYESSLVSFKVIHNLLYVLAESPSGQRNYILETISMTTVTEQRVMREVHQDEEAVGRRNPVPPGGSPISGILKGGRLWKQQSVDVTGTANSSAAKQPETQQVGSTIVRIVGICTILD